MSTTKNIKWGALCASLIAFSGCHDLTTLNEDPYNPVFIPGDKDPDEGGDEGDGKYADLDMNYTISEAELENLKNGQSKVGTLFAQMTYEGCYNDYQITTNLTHDIYSGFIANNKPNFNFNSPTYAYTDGWSSARWNHFYSDRSSTEYAQL
ncbi:MAG: SusD/RagB family nutrient-binding outer membrane lipoprotein, partial [Bacteroidales bacterium]